MPRKTAQARNPSRPLAAPILPEVGFVRLSDILRVLPIGRSTWWAWVKTGKAPAGVKIGANTTAWRAEEIRELLRQFGG